MGKEVLLLTKLYHASSIPGINTLKAVLPLHGSDGEKVVCLTESLPGSPARFALTNFIQAAIMKLNK